MNCKSCESDKIYAVSGKCSDSFNGFYKGKDINGYVTYDVGIGGGDYLEFDYCLNCGQIQDDFPIAEKDFEEAIKDD